MGDKTLTHYIDYNNVTEISSEINGIADDMEYSHNIMIYSYPNTESMGEFATEFESLRTLTDGMVNDMKIFIDQYAKLVISILANYENLDMKISDIISSN